MPCLVHTSAHRTRAPGSCLKSISTDLTKLSSEGLVSLRPHARNFVSVSKTKPRNESTGVPPLSWLSLRQWRSPFKVTQTGDDVVLLFVSAQLESARCDCCHDLHIFGFMRQETPGHFHNSGSLERTPCRDSIVLKRALSFGLARRLPASLLCHVGFTFLPAQSKKTKQTQLAKDCIKQQV